MRKTFVLLAALLIASTAWGAYRTLTVTGNTVFGTTAADTMTVNATLTFQAATGFAAGTALLPGLCPDGDPNTGIWASAADTLNISAAGAEVAEIDGTGLNNCVIGATTPLAATVTTFTTGGQTDLDPGAVGAPTLAITGSLTTGPYQSAADEWAIAVAGAQVTRWDGTGCIATGFNGPLGTVTPAAVTATDGDFSGTFNLGQEPADLWNGYRAIGDTVVFFDGFDYSDADLATHWDLTNVVGAGTNTVSVRPGWNEVVTGGGGGPDAEGTSSNYLTQEREYTPRIETVADLTAVAAGQTFSFGFYAAANEYILIMHEPATNANWILRADDTGGAETIDSGVAAGAGNPTKLAITIAADGTTTWAIDDVAMTVVGLTNLMTANPYYAWMNLTDVAAAAHTAAIDYILIEQLKEQ